MPLTPRAELRYLALLALLWLADAGASETAALVSVLNVDTGAALTIWDRSVGQYLWGYWPFDTRNGVVPRNWYIDYHKDGSLSLRSPDTRTCVASYYSAGATHDICNADDLKQHFLPLLTSTGAVQLRNVANGDCLRAYSSGVYSHAFDIGFTACPTSGTISAQQLWILGPALTDALRLDSP